MGNSDEFKVCTCCKEQVPKASFGKRKASKDGLYCWCRPCVNADKKRKYDANPGVRERIKATGKARYERDKDRINAQKDEYRRANAEAHAARTKSWYHRNLDAARTSRRASTAKWLESEKGKAYIAKWSAENPELKKASCIRRRKRAGYGYFSVHIMRELWHKQKGLCMYCRATLGLSPKDTSAYHIDHIWPVSKGGTNDKANLQCLCPTCNRRKSAKLPHEFAQERGMLF